jgi:hypothetical protein
MKQHRITLHFTHCQIQSGQKLTQLVVYYLPTSPSKEGNFSAKEFYRAPKEPEF